MGGTIGAFDQGFASYGFLVGGTDMAHILFKRATNRTDSEVAIALEDINLDETLMRNELALADSMTWLHRYKNKKYFAVNASRDDIIDYDVSVKPMLEVLSQNDNQLITKLNDDTHSPTGSFIKKMKQVFIPLLDFIVDGAKTYDVVCPTQN